MTFTNCFLSSGTSVEHPGPTSTLSPLFTEPAAMIPRTQLLSKPWSSKGSPRRSKNASRNSLRCSSSTSSSSFSQETDIEVSEISAARATATEQCPAVLLLKLCAPNTFKHNFGACGRILVKSGLKESFRNWKRSKNSYEIPRLAQRKEAMDQTKKTNRNESPRR